MRPRFRQLRPPQSEVHGDTESGRELTDPVAAVLRRLA
jgi:hypothetical protein